jgi:hypothetical protein
MYVRYQNISEGHFALEDLGHPYTTPVYYNQKIDNSMEGVVFLSVEFGEQKSEILSRCI